jgi:hypothetical protein
LKGDDFSRADKINKRAAALQVAEKLAGGDALYRGTTLVLPIKPTK